jgi:peptide/nickel transport system substrate-binding protein
MLTPRLRHGTLAVLLLGAPTLSSVAQPTADLTVAVQAIAPVLEPGADISNVAWRVTANLFDTLVGYDYARDFAPVPRLAESWRRLDDRTVEFRLREGARFHDGSPVTADDVAFTFGPERMTGERAPTRALTLPFLGTVAGAEVVDPRTVRIRASQPDPLLEVRLASQPAGIISRAAYLAAPSFQAWALNPMGSGPYRLRAFRTDRDVTLEAMPTHWSGTAPARSIRFWVVPEVAGRIAAVRSREAGIATDIPPDQRATLRGVTGVEFVGGPIANHRLLNYDTTNPVLRDPRVRQAIGLAIDRETIVRELWGSAVEVPRGFQFPAFRDLYFADRPRPAYDPARARALLREAGYRGEQIEFRFIGYGYYTNEVQTTQILAEMFRAVGLNVRLASRENFSQIHQPEGRGIRHWSNTMALPDPVGALWRLHGARGVVQTTYREWRNEEFNALGRTLETSNDVEERRRAWARMLDIYERDDPPGTVLHQNGMFYVKRQDIQWSPLPVEWMEFRAGQLALP